MIHITKLIVQLFYFSLNNLSQINQDIAAASQRVAYFFNDLKVQDRVKGLNLWRLQTMTYRPGHDHIRDAPIQK